MSDQKYTDDDLRRVVGIVNEQIDDKVQLILEAVSDIQQKVNRLPKMEEDLGQLKSDVRVIKAAVTDTSHQVHDLEEHASVLEARV